VPVRAVGLVLVLLLVAVAAINMLGGAGPQISDPVESTTGEPELGFPEAIRPFCPSRPPGGGTAWDERPVHLEVVFDDQRGWATNLFEAWLGLAEFDGITPSSKRSFGAVVVLTYADGGECVDRAEVRLHGDWIDHIGPVAEGIQASVDVELKSGHAGGVREFKLLLPGSRYGDNEVLAALLFRAFGFVSPRTHYLNTSVNGMDVRYLFQEKMREPMLMRHGLPESPIFQSDERLGYDWTAHTDDPDVSENPHVFTVARLANGRYVRSSLIARAIVEEGLSRLNQAYAQVAAVVPGAERRVETSHPGDGVSGTRILTETALPVFGRAEDGDFTEADRFTALFLAIGDEGTGSVHGLQSHNQRFVYDPWSGTLRPIYYDGQVALLRSELPTAPRIREWIKEALGRPRPVVAVTPATSHAATALREELADLSIDDLVAEVRRNGARTPEADIRSLLGPDGFIDQRLAGISQSGGLRATDRLPRSPFAGLMAPGVRLVFKSPTGAHLSCPVGQGSCDRLALTDNEWIRLLRGDFAVDGAQYLYVGNSPDDYRLGRVQPNRLEAEWSTGNGPGSTQIHWWGDIAVEVDSDSRVLEVVAGLTGGRVVIVGGRLADWWVTFEGPREVEGMDPSKGRYDGRGVSGCLTFREVDLVDVRISIRGAACEDGLHLLRSSGSIIELEVVGAAADAVDMDHSTIEMGSVVISGAANDCLDLSIGRYVIGWISVDHCGDKGLSVGEAAVLGIEELEADDVSVGIATKDSARVDIGVARVDGEICAMAYRKKREFSGGELRIRRLDCGSGEVRQQEGSLVEVGS
ncbi:uncharacterized protein METZ01_LOCUS52165, partial [marine metagenome]